MEGASTQAMLLWRAKRRVHGASREVCCTAEQLGEGFFELRLRAGDRQLLCEPFEDMDALLRRAEQLRIERTGMIV